MVAAAPPVPEPATKPYALPPLLAADAAGATHVGLVRAVDQDRVLVTPRVLAVADGMGGANAGEVAAQVAVEVVRGIAGVLDPAAALPEAVRCANAAVHALAATSPDLRGMGTTLTALALGDDGLTVAHVGDSRLYRLRSGALTRLTRDHNAAEGLGDREGDGVPALAARSLASVLLRAVGPREEVDVDVAHHDALSGDRWLLCTDGLVKHVGDDEIVALLEGARTAREAVAALVDATVARGAGDNVGVAVLVIP
jgi:serine/threonine protein phosphatase PrpC